MQVLGEFPERVHVPPLPKLPPAPPSFQLTVPVGTTGELLVLISVAVKLIELPIVVDDDLGVIEALVASQQIVRGEAPLLPE